MPLATCREQEINRGISAPVGEEAKGGGSEGAVLNSWNFTGASERPVFPLRDFSVFYPASSFDDQASSAINAVN
jgi:hypothetical protein